MLGLFRKIVKRPILWEKVPQYDIRLWEKVPQYYGRKSHYTMGESPTFPIYNPII